MFAIQATSFSCIAKSHLNGFYGDYRKCFLCQNFLKLYYVKQKQQINLFVCFDFVLLLLIVTVNSYGYVRTVNSDFVGLLPYIEMK